MDQQSAYEQTQSKLTQINSLLKEARDLAATHEVEFTYDGAYYSITEVDFDTESWYQSDDSWYDSGY